MFDSGFGGLTVLKQLMLHLPYEEFIYLGDTARLPYGTKSPETIVKYTQECCAYLSDLDVKMIVIACNTASAVALETVASHFEIPILGVIDPVIQTLAASRIGVWGTRATISSQIYQNKLHHALPHSTIIATPTQLLVSLVEEGFIDHPITHLAIREYLGQTRIDMLVLACTHFPLLKSQIEKITGPQIQVIDPAIPAAIAARNKLGKLNLLAENRKTNAAKFYVTDDPARFAALAPQFLGQLCTSVELLKTSLIF